MPGDPLAIDFQPRTPLGRAALTAARPLLSRLIGLDGCRELYERVKQSEGAFAERVLDACGVDVQLSPDDNQLVPPSGPLIIAANHPHGAVDGLALAALVSRVRPDVRLVANHLLARIPEIRDSSFFVDPFEGAAGAARSRAGLRSAHLWLRQGGALVIFPAGEVAHMPRPDGSFADSPWHNTVGRLALATGAPVLPAYITGRNSPWFYLAGRAHPLLRTAMLARELLNKRGAVVQVCFGPPMMPRTLPHESHGATSSIRAEVERLGESGGEMAAEIRNLPPDACLAESGSFQVFCARAEDMPRTLVEIGRLREAAFQAVGEGTGRAIDLDRFDADYLHLFSWDRRRRQVVGAYRIGRADAIVAARGVEGLYTHTLFKYDERLLARLSPALELGRSFVRAEYQRDHGALLLLWKGIGRFVARHREYRVLFGPVSISSRYDDVSLGLLTQFLEQNHLDRATADLVEARHPRLRRPEREATPVPASMEEVSRLVSRDSKGVPVLLRQYLKLNARLAGFSVDPDFGDALDALMIVDLTTVDRSILNRYLGRDEAERYLAYHSGGRREIEAA